MGGADDLRRHRDKSHAGPVLACSRVLATSAARGLGDPLSGDRPQSHHVADDHQDTREMIAWCMRAAGWLVSQASDGQEAIELAVALKPHAIVMDICMPALDGLDAIVWLRMDARTRGIPIVACTGLDRARIEERAKPVRYDGFVAKPCRPEELLALLEKLTGSPSEG
jgi:CheY-like chemotaxis protein